MLYQKYGDPVKFNVFEKKLYVDITGIPANSKDIKNLLTECSYVKLPSKLDKLLPNYYTVSELGVDFAICKNNKTLDLELIPIDEIPDNIRIGDMFRVK